MPRREMPYQSDQTTGPLWNLIHKKCMIQDVFPATSYRAKRRAATILDSDVARLSKTRPQLEATLIWKIRAEKPVAQTAIIGRGLPHAICL
ncbi:hypothetical protein N7533_006891 [Penicillium manginii]|uniref:uncharacterized protein n=1 Tax=Penicillium manginii TaxID=203109 RepID=UPI002546E57A|nr:uncharacterized protein N7533_006891 [Penicillium manginii]KAJ5749863.1 hypothetical protein N7533_006891 [Penicillium manginii]